MITKLIRKEDGKLSQNGIADNCPVDLRKQVTMKRVGKSRLGQTTPAEKKLTFNLQALVWIMGDRVCPYQREKTVHIANILSRSLDFYFACSKVGIEIDGKSHSGEIQAAKDEWTDRLISEHANIQIMRFKNEEVFGSIHSVMGRILTALMVRHSWPRATHQNFTLAIQRTATPESWHAAGGEFLSARNGKRGSL